MLEPEEVNRMIALYELGWGQKRIARELGVARNTVKRYVATGGWVPYRAARRLGKLDGLGEWLKECFWRHRGNCDVVRQELVRVHGIVVSLRTVKRAHRPWRAELMARARATVRFETPPGRQMQIDFGEATVGIVADGDSLLDSLAARPFECGRIGVCEMHPGRKIKLVKHDTGAPCHFRRSSRCAQETPAP